MLLIGFCVNILVAGIYYAFVGIFNGVRKMFYRPNTISALLITQGIYTKDVSERNNDSMINKNTSTGEKGKDYVYNEAIRHQTSNNVVVEISSLRGPITSQSEKSFPSLRCTLREVWKDMTRQEGSIKLSH